MTDIQDDPGLGDLAFPFEEDHQFEIGGFGSNFIPAFKLGLKLQLFPQDDVDLPIHGMHFDQIEPLPEELEVQKHVVIAVVDATLTTFTNPRTVLTVLVACHSFRPPLVPLALLQKLNTRGHRQQTVGLVLVLLFRVGKLKCLGYLQRQMDREVCINGLCSLKKSQNCLS